MEEFVDWINKRIETLEEEKQATPFMDVKLAKGAKAKGLKECLDYIRTHEIN